MTILSWNYAAIVAAVIVIVQAADLLRKGHTAPAVFVWLVISVYLLSVYVAAVADPTLYLLRSGILTRLGVILCLAAAVYTMRSATSCPKKS